MIRLFSLLFFCPLLAWGQSPKQLKTDNYYEGLGGLKNYYASFYKADNKITNPLILVVGAEDPTQTWYETVSESLKRGFQKVYLIEIRGQGLSERTNDRKIIHVNSFDDYNHDFIAAMKDIHAKQALDQPIFIISHSTGSTIVTNSIENLKTALPQLEIKKMAFWTPLIQLNISGLLNNIVVRPILGFVETVYSACCGILVGKKYSRKPFEENHLTNDKQKYQALIDLYKSTGQRSFGVSMRWALEAIKATKKMQKKSLPQLTIPTLNFLATDDHVVTNFKPANPIIVSEEIEGAKHALHFEKPNVFNPLVTKTFDFFLETSP